MLAGSLEYGLAVGGYRQPARQVEQLAGLRLGLAQRLQLPTLTRGQVAGERSHQQKEHQRQHIFFALNAEREVGRYEQEVIDQERQRSAGQRRSQATAHRHQQHRRQEHQRDIGQCEHTGHRPGQARSHHGGQQRQQVMTPHPHPPHRRTRRWRLHITVQHVDFQAMTLAQQPRRHTGAEQTPAQTVTGLPDQHQAGPPLGSMLNQRAGHFTSTQQHHFPAQSLGQLLSGLQTMPCGFVT